MKIPLGSDVAFSLHSDMPEPVGLLPERRTVGPHPTLHGGTGKRTDRLWLRLRCGRVDARSRWVASVRIAARRDPGIEVGMGEAEAKDRSLVRFRSDPS